MLICDNFLAFLSYKIYVVARFTEAIPMGCHNKYLRNDKENFLFILFLAVNLMHI